MIISKQKYIRVLERTIKSYPKKIRNKLFPYFWSPLQIEEKTGLSVACYKGKNRKLVFGISDKVRIGTFRTSKPLYYLPNYVRTNWPTLPLWKKAIQDAVKVRLKMITSKQKYLVILERTLRSYSKELQQRLFPNIFPPYVLFVSSAILVNQLSSEGFWIGLHIKNGKPQATFGDNSGHYGSVFGPQELPDYVCKQYPTLPLWEKAIRDAVKNRLIKLMKL